VEKMIQRIQTLYLLLVIILSVVTLFSVQVEFLGNAEAVKYFLSYKGVISAVDSSATSVYNVWSLTALCVLMPLVALATVFMFKRRILQIRLSIINSVLFAGYYGLLFLYIWQVGTALNADWHLGYATAFPLINIILTFLAIRAIGKDEALIKSLNRLR
jgi:hypothetical protein